MAKRGRPSHKTTNVERDKIKFMAIAGATAEQIADALGISRKTFFTLYKKEFQEASKDANATVVGRLFAMTKKNPAAAIFWCKTRLGWKDNAEANNAVPEQTIINLNFEAEPAHARADDSTDKAA